MSSAHSAPVSIRAERSPGLGSTLVVSPHSGERGAECAGLITRPDRLLGPGRPYLRNGICYGCGVVLDLCTGVEVTVTNVKGHPFYEVGDVLRIHRGIA